MPVQCSVRHHQRLLERECAGEVGQRARHRGHRDAVDIDDLVDVQPCRVHVQHRGAPAAGAAVPGDVDAVQGDVPQHEAVQRGGGDVADDRVR